MLTFHRLGNQAWTNALEWPGKKAYNKAETEDFKLDGEKEKFGSFKTSGNFTFVQIHAAGHMVPYDQPLASLEMLNRWLSGDFKA